MWRIVFTSVIQLCSLQDKPTSGAPPEFERFISDPCDRTIRNEDKVTCSSALHIVKECLRLYPPVRRISRDIPGRGEVKADIEKCQRNFLLADFEPD
jgi:hypothetical protein